MGNTRNYPKNIFEQFDIELCNLERAVKMLQKEKARWPLYEKARLPSNIADGNAFVTDTGEFCIKFGDNIYCMPGVDLGRCIYSLQQVVNVSWSSSPQQLYKIATVDVDGENIIYFNENYNSASPVWCPDFKRILYTEVGSQQTGAPEVSARLCIINEDGTGRDILHESGLSGINSYDDYAMSPDEKKVALKLRDDIFCVWADGSGDCGGGRLGTITAYDNIQWSSDSQTIYTTGFAYNSEGDSQDGIMGANFQTPGFVGVYELFDIDYFWTSNDFSKWAIPMYYWPGVPSPIFQVATTDGVNLYAWGESDIPWPNPDQPPQIFWAPDDSFLILTGQRPNDFSGHGYSGIAVRTTPDLSEWQEFHWPVDSSDRGIVNWTLATVGGELKLLGAGHSYPSDPDLNGSGIFQWDIKTGEQEGWIVTSPWADANPILNRYSICGLHTCTADSGTQIWDLS